MTEDNIGLISDNKGKVTWEIPGFSLQQVLPLAPLLQHKTDHLKYVIKSEDEAYLRKHPEVSAIAGLLTEQVLRRRPKSVAKFARQIFSNPNIRNIIEKRVLRSKSTTKSETLNWVLQPYKVTNWREAPQYDCGIESDEESDLSEDESEEGDDSGNEDDHKEKLKHKHTRKSILSGGPPTEKDLQKEDSPLSILSKEFIENYMLKYFDEFGELKYDKDIESGTEVKKVEDLLYDKSEVERNENDEEFEGEELHDKTEILNKDGIEKNKVADELLSEILGKQVEGNEIYEKGKNETIEGNKIENVREGTANVENRLDDGGVLNNQN